jgi:hypothetical protein
MVGGGKSTKGEDDILPGKPVIMSASRMLQAINYALELRDIAARPNITSQSLLTQ